MNFRQLQSEHFRLCWVHSKCKRELKEILLLLPAVVSLLWNACFWSICIVFDMVVDLLFVYKHHVREDKRKTIVKWYLQCWRCTRYSHCETWLFSSGNGNGNRNGYDHLKYCIYVEWTRYDSFTFWVSTLGPSTHVRRTKEAIFSCLCSFCVSVCVRLSSSRVLVFMFLVHIIIIYSNA